MNSENIQFSDYGPFKYIRQVKVEGISGNNAYVTRCKCKEIM